MSEGCMAAKLKSWEVSEKFWNFVEPFIPEKQQAFFFFLSCLSQIRHKDTWSCGYH